MMKIILSAVMACTMTIANAQSKKEQIENLTFSLDSLNQVVAKERQSFKKEVLAKDAKIYSQENQIDQLKEKINQNKQVLVSRDNTIRELDYNLKNLELETGRLRDSLVQMLTLYTNSIQVLFADFYYTFGGTFDLQPKEMRAGKVITYSFKSYWPEAYFEDSQKMEYAAGEFKNGYKNGYWKYTRCDGEIMYEGNYLNGQKQGKWTNYYHCSDPSDGYSFLSFIYTIREYYELEWLFRISKEEIIFDKGIPNEFFYYRDDQDNVILKINYKTGDIFYDNDQPLTNQSTQFEYPLLKGNENKELHLYHRNGTVAYKMIDSGNQKSVYYYGLNGSLVRKCSYLNNYGNCEFYNENGTLVYNYELGFGSGKYGWDCHCQ